MSDYEFCTEAERLEAMLEGCRKAYVGISDTDRRAALAYFMNYAKRNKQFLAGDVLSSWRKTNDPIAHNNWRNKWGGLTKTLSSKSWGVIVNVGETTPRNIQSHSSYCAVWESQIYVDD